VVKEAQDEASNNQSLLNRRGTCGKAELTTLLDNVETALKELENLVDQYQKLGRKQKDVWTRVKFGTEALDTIERSGPSTALPPVCSCPVCR
jgi:hypothetical protein